MLLYAHKHEAESFQSETSENSSLFSALVPNINVLQNFLYQLNRIPVQGFGRVMDMAFCKGVVTEADSLQ